MTRPASEVRILVIDDEKELCALLAQALTSQGYQVDTAHDGAEGLLKFQRNRYSLVLSDVRMPKLNGMETLEAIKRQDPHVEVILLTAYGTVPAATKALKSGAFDYLEKPVSLKKLAEIVQSALDRREMRTIKGFEETARAVFSTILLPELLPLLADLALTAAPCEDSFIALSEGKGLKMTAWSSLHGTPDQEARLQAAGVVVENAEHAHCFSAAAATDPRFAKIEGVAEIQHILGYPMWSQKAFLGVIGICRTRGDENFSVTEINNFSRFAALVTQAIRSASLYADLETKMKEIQRAEQRAIQYEKMAALGRIISGLAHELKNPLSSILLNAQLMERSAKDAAVGMIVEDIQTSANRCCAVIENLLSYSRAARTDKQACPLTDVIETSLRLANGESQFPKIKVVREFPEKLQPVLVNAIQMQQVFRNLFVNAMQAMPENGTVTIRLRELMAGQEAVQRWAAPGASAVIRNLEDLQDSRGEPWVIAEIKDEGVGISHENLTKIFEPFFTTKDPGAGTGLGLYLSYEIVRANGGALCVSSPGPGQGTSFFVVLPAAVASEQSAAPRSERAVGGTR